MGFRVGRFLDLFLFFIFALGIWACQDSSNSQSQSVLNESYRKIDQGDCQGAIRDLQALLPKDPRRQVREALASAHAACAGVKIENFFDFVKSLQAPPITQEGLRKHILYINGKKELDAKKTLLSKDFQKDVGTLLEITSALDLYRQKIETLPYVSDSGRVHLISAIEVLDPVPAKGTRLYRAALLLVLVRSEFQDGFVSWTDLEEKIKQLDVKNPQSTDNKTILCELEISDFKYWLDGQFQRIREISKDLKVAFPSKSIELLKLDISVQSLQKDLAEVKDRFDVGGCE